MRTVTFRFCGFNSFFGRVIAWFTQGRYLPGGIGHVDLVMDDGRLLGSQHEDGIGGMPAGVQVRPADYGRSCGMLGGATITVEVSEEQYHKFWGFLERQLGKPYDTIAILAFIFGRDWRQSDSWYCSELAAMAAEEAGIFKYPLAAQANRITPSQLLLVLSAFAPVVKLSS